MLYPTIFGNVHRIVLRRAFLTDLAGDAEVMDIIVSTVLPGYRSFPSARIILKFIARPLCTKQADAIERSPFMALSSDSSTDRAAKKEEMIWVRVITDYKTATTFFSCQALPGGDAHSIVTAYN